MAAIIYGLKRPAALAWQPAWEGLALKYQIIFRELNSLIDPKGGYKNYWKYLKSTETPKCPFFGNFRLIAVPFMQDLYFIHDGTPMTYDEPNEPISTKRINFQKYYDLYSIVADLESYRLSPHRDKVKIDREVNNHLVQHIQEYSMPLEDSQLASGTIFSCASNPSGNQQLNSPEGNKQLKKLVAMSSIGVSL